MKKIWENTVEYTYILWIIRIRYFKQLYPSEYHSTYWLGIHIGDDLLIEFRNSWVEFSYISKWERRN